MILTFWGGLGMVQQGLWAAVHGAAGAGADAAAAASGSN